MIIGLTGGIACGKSEAAGFFQKRGFQVVDCDGIVHELLESDEEVFEALREKWGDQVISSQGRVDRRALARIVFDSDDEGALPWLEALLHPKVHARWNALIKNHQKEHEHWVIEIPLLFEKKLEESFDCTVCIMASKEQQFERLRGKGFSQEEAEARVAAQLPLEEKCLRADYVLLNDGALDFLKKQVDLLVASLRG